jgi:hypothetical protein
LQRVAIVGIDGSGKTSTAVKLVDRLAQRMDICKPGRPPLVTRGGEQSTFMPGAAREMEQRLRRADQTGKRLRVALSRRRYVRWITGIERVMVRRFSPDLLLLARCPVVDPAVYAEFYLPRLARALPLAARLRLSGWLSRVPPRDLYFLLDTPVAVAMERIQRRLKLLSAAADGGREHWLHMHERPDVLEGLARGIRAALELEGRRTGAGVVVVDNASMRQDGVVELMAERILARARGRGPLLSVPRQDRQLPAADDSRDLGLGPAPDVPDPDQLALVPLGGQRAALLEGGRGLKCRVLDLGAGRALGPYVLDPAPCQRLALLGPHGPGEDPWLLYTAQGDEGAGIWLARLAGSGQPGRWDPELAQPGLLSRAGLLSGSAAAGAWSRGAAGEPRALMVYAEPSRTELWGALLNGDGRVARRPERLAAADPDWLLCDRRGRGWTSVRWRDDGEQPGWLVRFATHHADPHAGQQARHLELAVDADGQARGGPRPAAPAAEAGPPWVPGHLRCLAFCRLGPLGLALHAADGRLWLRRVKLGGGTQR